jgi:hypothetical protein
MVHLYLTGLDPEIRAEIEGKDEYMRSMRTLQEASFMHGDLVAKRNVKKVSAQATKGIQIGPDTNIMPSSAAPEETVCYNCETLGHYAQECPEPKRDRKKCFRNQSNAAIAHAMKKNRQVDASTAKLDTNKD